MEYKRAIQFLFLVVAATLVKSGCTPESCYEETISAVKAGFYETGSGINIAADSVTLYGVGMEADTIYKNVKNIKELLFFLNPSEQSSSFVLVINGITDTITFNYNSFPYLISKECGYSIFHTITSSVSTNNLIDTVLVRNPNIKTPYEENVRIFY